MKGKRKKPRIEKRKGIACPKHDGYVADDGLRLVVAALSL